MTEVWALKRLNGGGYLPPALDDDGTESFLAWPTREQAERGVAFQTEMGYIDEDNPVKIERIA